MHLLIIPLALAAAALLYQTIGAFLDRRRLPPPGRLVDAGGHRLHVRTCGSGSPAIVLEAGIAASSVSWALVEPELARSLSVISYDRAGLAWSERPGTPRTPQRLIQELRTVLAATGAEPPFVLVGHSFGGLLVRLYAAAHPEDVAGLVLIDPALVSEWQPPLSPARAAMLARGVRFSRRGAWLARFGVVRFGLSLAALGLHALPKAIARASSSGRGQSLVERLVGEIRKLPLETRPAMRAHWSRPGSFLSMAEHLELLPAMCSAARNCGSLGDLPLAVISGAHLSREQRSEHEALARLSTRGRHLSAPSGAHWVHLDHPELVIGTVLEVAAEAHR